MSLRVGLLNLVDLAGSEAISRAQTEGQAKLEGSNINKSLLALSKVISQIVQRQQLRGAKDDANRNIHINYRDSKLTRLLSNSLGGNSKTAIICCISPELVDYRESLSTIDFASRAKCIRNRVKINLISAVQASERKELEEENRSLRQDLVQLRHELLQATEKLKASCRIPEQGRPTSAEASTIPPLGRQSEPDGNSQKQLAAVEKAQSAVEKMQWEINEVENVVKLQQKELEVEKQALLERIRVYEENNKAKTIEMQIITKRYEELSETHGEIETQFTALKTLYEKEKKKMDNRESEYEDLTLQQGALEVEKQALLERIRIYEENDKAKTNEMQIITKRHEELSETNREMETQFTALKIVYDKEKKKLDNRESECEDLELKLRLLEASEIQRATEIDRLRIEARNLKTELNLSRNETLEAKQEAVTTKELLIIKEEIVQELQRLNEEQKNELQVKLKAIGKLHEEVHIVNALQDEKKQLEANIEDKIAAARREVKGEAAAELYEAKKKIYDMEGKLEDKESEINATKHAFAEKLKALEKENEQYKKTAEESIFAEVAQLQAEQKHNEIELKYRQARNELTELHQDYNELQDTKMEIEMELRSKLDQLELEKQELKVGEKQRRNEMESATKAKEQQIKTLELQIHRLEAENDHLKDLKEETEINKDKAAQLAIEAKVLKVEKDKINDQLQLLYEELQEWKSAYQETQSAAGNIVKSLTDELEDYKKRLGETQRDARSLEKEIESLQSEKTSRERLTQSMALSIMEHKEVEQLLFDRGSASHVEAERVLKACFDLMDVNIERLSREKEKMSNDGNGYNAAAAQTMLLSPTIQTHLLLTVLSQEYSVEAPDVVGALIDVCTMVGSKWRQDLLTLTKTEETFTLKVGELEKSIKSAESRYNESIRKTRLDAEKEIDQLRMIALRNALAQKSSSSPRDVSVDTCDLEDQNGGSSDNSKLLEEIQKVNEQLNRENETLNQTIKVYKESMESQKFELMKMIDLYKLQWDEANKQVTSLLEEKDNLKNCLNSEIAKKSEYHKELLSLQFELKNVKKELQEKEEQISAATASLQQANAAAAAPKRFYIARSSSRSCR